jgi:hypothetical protein
MLTGQSASQLIATGRSPLARRFRMCCLMDLKWARVSAGFSPGQTPVQTVGFETRFGWTGAGDMAGNDARIGLDPVGRGGGTGGFDARTPWETTHGTSGKRHTALAGFDTRNPPIPWETKHKDPIQPRETTQDFGGQLYAFISLQPQHPGTGCCFFHGGRTWTLKKPATATS